MCFCHNLCAFCLQPFSAAYFCLFNILAWWIYPKICRVLWDHGNLAKWLSSSTFLGAVSHRTNNPRNGQKCRRERWNFLDERNHMVSQKKQSAHNPEKSSSRNLRFSHHHQHGFAHIFPIVKTWCSQHFSIGSSDLFGGGDGIHRWYGYGSKL